MSADLVLGAVVYLLQSEIDLSGVVRYVYGIGAVVMAYLAYHLLVARHPDGGVEPGGLSTYSTAFAIGISNPFQILWWLTAGLAFAYMGGLLLLAALFGAIAIWIVAFPYAIHAGVRRYPRVERAVTIACGAILAGFAVYFAVLAL